MYTAPYSPFFMSGLLSSPVDRPASPDVPLGPRRGSLPTDTSTRSVETGDQASAFYFTLQPRRDEQEYRSFLSLDLAESQSLRSASLKRKASSRKPFKFPSIPEDSAAGPSAPAAPRTCSLRTRFSRDSLRTIPSPKPAPSITLPDLPPSASISPQPASAPPRLPSLPALPALELPLPMPAPMLSIRVSRTHYPFPSPPSSSIHLSSIVSRRVSVATKATASTVSTRARRGHRSAALAALEGRACRSTPLLVSPKHARQSNFMSMSDDEDELEDVSRTNMPMDVDRDMGMDIDMEEDADDEDSDLDSPDFGDDSMFNALMEPEDVVFPLPCTTYLEAPRSAPLPPSASASPSTPFPSTPSASYLSSYQFPPRSQENENEHPLPTSTSDSRYPYQRPRATRRTTKTKDWFPLKSFIDLHNDDDHSSSTPSAGWSWRSFIEVANVS